MKTSRNPIAMSRRQALRTALFGTGLVGLQSLATGLPSAVFGPMGLGALDAYAAEGREPQYLLMFTSSRGEPFNCNAPGVYGVAGIDTNPQGAMAETAVTLGEVATTASAPWATLPQWVLDRTSVIHHRTYQNAHPQYAKVMRLVGSAREADGGGTEYLPSVVASEMHQALRTIQAAPIRMAGDNEELGFEGRPVQRIRPSTLAEVFSVPDNDNAIALAEIRQRALDDINALAKERGTPSQRLLIDRFATSREQVKSLDETLLGRLALIDGDDARNQLQAAITLFLMNLTPVATVQLRFGGDNHNDNNLDDEREQHVETFELLRDFFLDLEQTPLRDKVTVANLDVFGRTLERNNNGGRDHNLNHHVMMISGAGVRGGLHGKVGPSGNDFGATAIDSQTGEGYDGADIPEEETLEAAAKTLATAVGIDAETVERRIDGGKVIVPAIA
ncbi:MAG: DUF1501 domain-containing protein [Myxococcota bacterium]